MEQKDVVAKIKALKRELRLRFDDAKLIQLYRLIDLLK